jgi:DNA repair exonuclease SbcCD ATPase subunit
MQQQLAKDTEVRVKYKEKLEKELEKEEAELRELMAKALKYREQYQESQDKLVALEAKADRMWDECSEAEKTISALVFDEPVVTLE